MEMEDRSSTKSLQHWKEQGILCNEALLAFRACKETMKNEHHIIKWVLIIRFIEYSTGCQVPLQGFRAKHYVEPN